MSLYIELQINADEIGAVEVRRTTDVGSEPDSINTYRWQYARDDGFAVGLVTHRFGDGAIALASKVLADIAKRHQLAAQAQDIDEPKIITDTRKVAARARRGGSA